MGKKRYEVGIEKLNHAGSQVSIMQASLEALQPQLVVAASKVQETLKKVEAESAEAAIVEATVLADEEVANEQVFTRGLAKHFQLTILLRLTGKSCPGNQRRVRRKPGRSHANPRSSLGCFEHADACRHNHS